MDDIEDRVKQLNEIKNKVNICESELNGFLQELGWTREKLPKSTQIHEVKEEPSEKAPQATAERNPHRNLKVQETKPIDLETVVNLCTTIDQKRAAATNFIDLNKLKRDLKRRRVKYRTSTAPLTYTEELRELINLQMDLAKTNKDD